MAAPLPFLPNAELIPLDHRLHAQLLGDNNSHNTINHNYNINKHTNKTAAAPQLPPPSASSAATAGDWGRFQKKHERSSGLPVRAPPERRGGGRAATAHQISRSGLSGRKHRRGSGPSCLFPFP